MSKRPEVIVLANKGSIAFLEEIAETSTRDDFEMCLAVSAKDVSADFSLGITSAKPDCLTCKMLDECVSFANRFSSPGSISRSEKKQVAIPHGLSDREIGRFYSEMNFILHSPASEVSAHYKVDGRTVVRWRATLRAAL